jgi:hypothetical protein
MCGDRWLVACHDVPRFGLRLFIAAAFGRTVYMDPVTEEGGMAMAWRVRSAGQLLPGLNLGDVEVEELARG